MTGHIKYWKPFAPQEAQAMSNILRAIKGGLPTITRRRPVVACDVDGVLADLVSPLCAAIRERVPGSELHVDQIRHHDFRKSMTQAEYAAAMDIMSAPGFAFDLPWYAGAKDFVVRLSMRCDVIFLTSPFDSSSTWSEERKAWLRTVVPGAKPVMCPSQYKKHFGAAFLIEDHPGTLHDWCVEHPRGEGILINRPWSSHDAKEFKAHVGISRAFGYQHALNLIEDLIIEQEFESAKAA